MKTIIQSRNEEELKSNSSLVMRLSNFIKALQNVMNGDGRYYEKKQRRITSSYSKEGNSKISMNVDKLMLLSDYKKANAAYINLTKQTDLQKKLKNQKHGMNLNLL